MKRILLILGVLVAALAALSPFALGSSGPARATAVGQEIGGFPRPSCPGTACRVMTKTSGYNRAALGVRAPDTVPFTGKITSFRVRLGKPDSTQQGVFNGRFGGSARVAITILRLVKTKEHFVYKAEHSSEAFDVSHRFGQSPDFDLGSRPLPAKRGDIVALTVPSWAPVLAVQLDNSNSWRSSRRPHAGKGKDGGRGCSNFDQQTAHFPTTDHKNKQYICQYTTAVLVYSATIQH
jgi:hypothetical protein